MSFYEQVEQLMNRPLAALWQKTTTADVEQTLQKERLEEEDLLTLLSPAAQTMLETISREAKAVTERHFHKKISLFAPLYISDHCANHCVYCSFSYTNPFPRTKLTMPEIAREAKPITDAGIRDLIILTGDSPKETPVSYIRQSVETLRGSFNRLSIEINALDTEGYRELVEAGVSGLTIYQEVYDEAIYKEIHLKGPKRNYRYRLDAPERGCQAGMRNVNIGALLGMNDWRTEAFVAGMHAHYLQQRYPDTSIGLSIPRLRPFLGSFQPRSIVSDADLKQVIAAFRLFLPRSGLTLSTRESASLRDQLIHLGITKISAGVSTQVGGYSESSAETVPQFEISDERNVRQICDMITHNGYTPVLEV